jgi:hypothetical protein
MRSTVSNSEAAMGSGATILLTASFDLLARFGIGMSNDAICRGICERVLGLNLPVSADLPAVGPLWCVDVLGFEGEVIL